jgi:hypothetical protein
VVAPPASLDNHCLMGRFLEVCVVVASLMLGNAVIYKNEKCGVIIPVMKRETTSLQLAQKLSYSSIIFGWQYTLLLSLPL